jgi:hypothetical protein
MPTFWRPVLRSKKKTLCNVVGEDDQENEGRVQEVAVDVLNHQRQESLAR